VLSKARSDATNRINTAEADRTRVVQDITSFAKTFNQVLPRYQSNPDLFLQQRLVETMAIVFNNAQDKMFLPTSADGQPVELRLLLNREPPKPKAAETK
jgi:regulator of protease activity HflC (stomatin/prohibitin superfamily)